MAEKTTDNAVQIEDLDKLVFKQQYAAAKTIYIRANDGNLYPTDKDVIRSRLKILGVKQKDLKFFTAESVEAAKKKN